MGDVEDDFECYKNEVNTLLQSKTARERTAIAFLDFVLQHENLARDLYNVMQKQGIQMDKE